MKVFSSQGKFNVFIIFLILAISSSLVGKLTSTYDKDILFELVLTDLPQDKVVYDKSHDSVMLKVRGYGFNLAKYYFETPSLNISVKKLKEFVHSNKEIEIMMKEDTLGVKMREIEMKIRMRIENRIK